jgi:nicotinamide mononucleotide transporter
MVTDWKEILYFVISWSIYNAIEILATLTGILYIIFSVRASVFLWPLGLISSTLYVYVFFASKIYADMSVNLYYVAVSVYGWIHWYRKGHDAEEGEMSILNLTRNQWIVSLFFTGIFYLIIAWILVRYTDSDVPYLDSFTTSASIVATWMLARKIIEHWLFWIVVDTVSAGLYIYKGLYPTVVLYIILTVFAVMGYFEWTKIQKGNYAGEA